MQGKGANQMDTMGMSAKNARDGAPDLGRGMGSNLYDRELQARKHYVVPSGDLDGENRDPNANRQAMSKRAADNNDPLPYYYNNYDGLPAPYAAPSEQKDRMLLESAVRRAAGKEIAESDAAAGVIRTAPITETEIQYLKSMKDQAELAKFDEYVETFIDPRQPGNMKWLMEVYPDYVSRRLQQAHTDYEFALRNQMIDSWGINTFDDLHFKYLVDQGKITGPRLLNRRPPVDSSYTPGWLSPYNFQSPNKGSSQMALPFASAIHGRRPNDPANWTMDRSSRPLGRGNTEQQLAEGMYDTPGTTPRMATRGQDTGGLGGPRFGLGQRVDPLGRD